MPNTEYKLEIVLRDQQITTNTNEPKPGQTSPQAKPTDGEDKTKFLDKVKNSTALKAGGAIVGGAALIGKEMYDYSLTSAQALGHSNKALRMQETMKNVQRGASILGAAVVAGPIGALGVIAYQGLELAKENRDKIIAIELDNIQSQQNTKYLINNTSGRSR